MEEKLLLVGEFLAIFLEVSATLGYIVRDCEEIIKTSENQEQIEKAKVILKRVEKAREGITNYDNLKDNPEYKAIFAKYGIDKLRESMLKLP